MLAGRRASGAVLGGSDWCILWEGPCSEQVMQWEPAAHTGWPHCPALPGHHSGAGEGSPDHCEQPHSSLHTLGTPGTGAGGSSHPR